MGEQVYYTSSTKPVAGGATYTSTTHNAGGATYSSSQPISYSTGERAVHTTGATYEVPGTTTTTYDANQKYYTSYPANTTQDYTYTTTNYAM